MNQTIQTFTFGRTVVATMPKYLGIKPGTKLQVQKLRDGIMLRPTPTQNALATVDKIKGGLNFKKAFGRSLTPEELNKLFDEQYETVLPRR